VVKNTFFHSQTDSAKTKVLKELNNSKMKRITLCVFILSVILFVTFAHALTVQVDENIRGNPDGQKIGVLDKGTKLEKIKQEGNWIKFRLEGWIWAPSVGLKSGSPTGTKIRQFYQPVTVKEFRAFPEEYHNKKILLSVLFGGCSPEFADIAFYVFSVRDQDDPFSFAQIKINKSTHRELVNFVFGLKLQEKITVYGKSTHGRIFADDIKKGW